MVASAPWWEIERQLAREKDARRAWGLDMAAGRRDEKERRTLEAEHERAGEKQHASDPSDPWSEFIWSPCDPACIHARRAR